VADLPGSRWNGPEMQAKIVSERLSIKSIFSLTRSLGLESAIFSQTDYAGVAATLNIFNIICMLVIYVVEYDASLPVMIKLCGFK